MSFARLAELARSTAFRITLGYTLLFVVSFASLGLVLHWIALDAIRDEIAEVAAGELERLAEVHARFGLSGLAAAVPTRPSHHAGEPMRFLVMDAENRQIGGDLPAAVAGLVGPFYVSYALEGERRGLIGAGVRLTDGTYLAAGQSDAGAERASRAILDALVVVALVATGIGLAGGVATSRGALRRIARIDATTRVIVSGDLSARVPLRGARDEIDALTQSINGMLDRIQALMEELRHVTVDIAHDLRSPLGRLRQRLEQALAAAETADDFRSANAEAVEEVDAILALFEGLLRIAQIEAKARREAFARVDLSGALADLAETYAAVAEDGGRRFVSAVAPGVTVEGDRALLVQAAANLVENALRHTPEGSTVRLGLARGVDGIHLSVTDDGPGIPARERAAVLKPFHRLDASRATAGHGLGLALVAAVAGLHEAEFRLSDAGPGLRAELVLAVPRGPGA